jgi:hypothetical protein
MMKIHKRMGVLLCPCHPERSEGSPPLSFGLRRSFAALRMTGLCSSVRSSPRTAEDELIQANLHNIAVDKAIACDAHTIYKGSRG